MGDNCKPAEGERRESRRRGKDSSKREPPAAAEPKNSVVSFLRERLSAAGTGRAAAAEDAKDSPPRPALKSQLAKKSRSVQIVNFCFCYTTDSCSAAARQSRTSALPETWDVLVISQPCIRLDVLNAAPESSQDCCDVCAGLMRMSHQLLPLTRKQTPQDGGPGEHANGDPPGSFTKICTLGNFSDQNHQNNSGPHEWRCALHCHSASSNEPLWPCRSKKRAEQRKRARERSAEASAGRGEDPQPPAKRPVRSLATQCSHYKPLSH